MIFDFDKIEQVSIPNFKGGKKCAKMQQYLDENARILRGVLEPGASIGIHTHENNSEIVYSVSGEVVVSMDGETELLKPGMVHYCPMGHTHGMVNKGKEDFVMIAVVPEHRNSNLPHN